MSGMARVIAVLLVGGLMGATLVRIAPGVGTDERELDSRLNHASIQALRSNSGTDKSLVTYYLHYLCRLARGDLGYSQVMNTPVRALITERFPETVRSVASGLLLAWGCGLALAITSVMARRSSIDLLASVCAGIFLCVPAAVLALLFVIARAPGRLVLGLILFPKVFYYTRNLLERSAAQPYVYHAWARGLSRRRVLISHIMQPIVPQMLALGGVTVSMAFAAAVPAEVICDLPGIGQLAWKAAMGRDLNLLVDLTMIIVTITVIANAGASCLSTGPEMREA